jgi:EmrB/QacA subfamily drug resistance transporter
VDRTRPDVPVDGLALHSATGRIALAAAIGASAMAMLDATVVNVALPHIGADLGADVSDLQWVLTGYLLTLASLILLGGALGDRYGRRRIFLVGTIWFAAASVLCAAAPDAAVLVVARLLQGVGGALLTPGSLAIIQASFRESDRAPAVGAWSGLGGIAGAIGPLVGGLLVDGPGWRWAFLINVPVAAIVVVCARAAIPESRDPDTTRRLDWLGALLATITLGASTWALTEAAPRGWSAPTVVGAGALAVLAGIAFVVHLARSRAPLVPPALFAEPAFTVTNVATALLYAALGVTFFLVAYELQVAAGWSAVTAGLALLPVTVLMLVGSARSGALAQRIGPRPQLTLGPLLAAGGLLLLARVGPEADWVSEVLPGAALFGAGLVTFVAPLTATVMGSVDQRHVSVASGVNNAIARAGSLTALAVIPAATGLASATGAGAVTTAYRSSLVIAASLAALAAVVSFLGLSPRARAALTPRRTTCALDGSPIQPDPARCPMLEQEEAA